MEKRESYELAEIEVFKFQQADIIEESLGEDLDDWLT